MNKQLDLQRVINKIDKLDNSVDKLLEVLKMPISLKEYKEKHGYDYLEGVDYIGRY